MRGDSPAHHTAGDPDASGTRLRAACDDATVRAAVPVTGGLAVLYALATLVHFVAPTARPAGPLIGATAGTALLFGGMAAAFARRPVPRRWAGPLSGFVALTVLANVLLYAASHADPDDSLYFALTLVASGAFVLSLPWLVGVLFAAAAAWLGLMGLVLVEVSWLPRLVFGGGMLALALALRYARVRAVRGELRLRDEAERRRADAERSLAATEAARRAAEQGEEDLRALIAHHPDGILVVRDGVVLLANAAIAAALGRDTPAALEGRSLAELVPQDDHAALAAVRDPAAPRHFTCPFLRADGERVVLELALSRSIGYRGAPAVLLSLRDVTHRHEALQARLRAADRLSAIGTLAAGVAHEVNNPLAVTLANLSLAQEDADRLARGAVRTDLPGLLADARAGAERVSAIVQDLRLFARAGAPQAQPLDLAAVLASIARIAAPDLRANAALQLDLQPVPPVLADPATLAQLLLNLLREAVAGAPAAAISRPLALRCRGDHAGAVLVEIEAGGHAAEEGPPPPRAAAPLLAPLPAEPHAGLGLAWCRETARELGGRLVDERDVGQRLTLRLRLPAASVRATKGAPTADAALQAPQAERGSPDVPALRLARPPANGVAAGAAAAPEPAAAPPAAPAPAAPQGGEPGATGRRFAALVVDDEPPVRSVLRRVLRRFDVTEAIDGAEALAAIERQAFDLILCDVMMPRVPGSEVWERARTLRPGQESRIVFMTGGAFTKEAAAFLDGTLQPVVTKPFDLPTLRSLIERMTMERTPAG